MTLKVEVTLSDEQIAEAIAGNPRFFDFEAAIKKFLTSLYEECRKDSNCFISIRNGICKWPVVRVEEMQIWYTTHDGIRGEINFKADKESYELLQHIKLHKNIPIEF